MSFQFVNPFTRKAALSHSSHSCTIQYSLQHVKSSILVAGLGGERGIGDVYLLLRGSIYSGPIILMPTTPIYSYSKPHPLRPLVNHTHRSFSTPISSLCDFDLVFYGFIIIVICYR